MSITSAPQRRVRPPIERLGLPDLGVGLGMRVPHYEHIFEHKPKVDWFEVISENFMIGGGRPGPVTQRLLRAFRALVRKELKLR